MQTGERSELDEQLARWVTAEVISAAQAARIREVEEAAAHGRPARPAPAVGGRERSVSLVAEVVGYVGLALAVGATGLVVNQFWADLENWARLLLVATGAVLAAVAGWLAVSSRDAALVRLAGVLWLAAVGGVCVFTALLFTDVHRLSDDNRVTVTAAAGLLVALALHLRLPAPLQQAALFGCGVALVVGLVGYLGDRSGGWPAPRRSIDLGTYGTALWGLGVVWLLLAWAGVVRRPVGYVLGAALTLVAAELVRDASVRTSLGLGLVSAALLLAASVATRSRALLVVGTLGTFAFVAQTIAHNVSRREPGGSGNLGLALALFVAGALLVGVALAVGRLRRSSKEVSS